MNDEPGISVIDKESRDLSRMESVVSKGGEGFMHFIRSHYKNVEDKIENRLFFHDEEHTQAVANRVIGIVAGLRASGIEVTKEQELRAVFAAYGHDLIQKSDTSQETGKRIRYVGVNEKESADLVILFMDHIDQGQDTPVFTDMDKAVVREAILCTEPKFGSEVTIEVDGIAKQVKTVGQPRLASAQFLESHILALADITTSGIEDPDVMITEGQKLFQEENIRLNTLLDQGSIDQGIITSEMEAAVTADITRWLDSQPTFVQARDALLDTQLQQIGLQPSQIAKMRELVFNKFESSLKATQTRVADFKKLIEDTKTTLRDKLAFMGYSFTPSGSVIFS